MKPVLCFGNELLEGDNLAKELADEMHIQGYRFIKCNAPEEIMDYSQNKMIYLMDVVIGLDKVQFIDIGDIKATRSVSLHDIDVGFIINLLKKIEKLPKMKIIGLPNRDKEKVKAEVKALLLQENEQNS
jgi:hypothetical protein